MECYTNGYYTGYNPIACVPSGNISGPLYYPGQSWVDGNFKYQCYQNEDQGLGYNIIACVPSGKLDGPVYYPGKTWIEGSFKYRCEQTGNQGMTYNIVACLTSTNQEVAVGSTLAVPSKGIYECTRKQDGTVYNNVKAGCVRNNALVAYSTTWVEGSTQLMCVWANEKYEIKATACLTPEKVVVNVNTYKVIKEKYYKCVLNQQDATKAEFIEVKRSG